MTPRQERQRFYDWAKDKPEFHIDPDWVSRGSIYMLNDYAEPAWEAWCAAQETKPRPSRPKKGKKRK